MYISINYLADNAFPDCYCFDRKTYRLCDISHLATKSDETYVRYIPLFQVDKDAIENDFILDLHDKHLLRKYSTSDVCFEEFVQRNNLWNPWWTYYKRAVTQIAIHWCENNNINYRNE